MFPTPFVGGFLRPSATTVVVEFYNPSGEHTCGEEFQNPTVGVVVVTVYVDEGEFYILSERGDGFGEDTYDWDDVKPGFVNFL